MSSMTCGNCKKTHRSVAMVRACYEGLTFPCNWLIEQQGEDGLYVVECGAASVTDQRGYSCEAGHGHVHVWVRDTEGWDYAEDGPEADRLRKLGLDVVAMDGSAI